jgi:hypothetical protein
MVNSGDANIKSLRSTRTKHPSPLRSVNENVLFSQVSIKACIVNLSKTPSHIHFDIRSLQELPPRSFPFTCLINFGRLLVSPHFRRIRARQIDANLIKQQLIQGASISQVNPLAFTCAFLRVLSFTEDHKVVALRSRYWRRKPDLFVWWLLVDYIRADGWESEIENSSLCVSQLAQACSERFVLSTRGAYTVLNIYIFSLLL